MTDPEPTGLPGMFSAGLPEPPPDGLSRRAIAVLAAGGVAILVIIGVALVVVTSGGNNPRRPAAAGENPALVVPMSSGSPARTTPGGSPSAGSSPRPSASRSASARPSASASTVVGGDPRVLSVTVSADPSRIDACRGTLSTKITVSMTLSAPGTSVRYTINDLTTVRKTAQGTSFSETTQVFVTLAQGTHKIKVAVSQPSVTAAETSVDVECS